MKNVNLLLSVGGKLKEYLLLKNIHRRDLVLHSGLTSQRVMFIIDGDEFVSDDELELIYNGFPGFKRFLNECTR